MASHTEKSRFTFPVIVLIFYILVEYGKPSVLDPLRPALVLQGVLAFLILFNLNKFWPVVKDKFFRLYLFLMVEMVVHVFIAYNNYWAFYALRTVFSYFLVAVGLCMFVDSIEKLKVFLSGFVGIFLVCAIDEMATGGSYIGGSGSLGDTNDFALAMNVLIPITYFLGLFYTGFKRKMLWGTAVVFIFANVSTLSRGGFIGLLSVVVACWWLTSRNLKGIAVFLLFGLAFMSVVPADYKKEMGTIMEEGADTGTGLERIELWKIGWRAFVANPVIGVGQGNLPLIMSRYQTDESGESFFKRGLWRRALHSVYLTALPELGVVGAIILIMMVKDLYRKWRAVTGRCKVVLLSRGDAGQEPHFRYLKYGMLGLGVGVLGYLVSGIFLSAFYYAEFWNLAGLMTAVYMLYKNLLDRNDRPSRRMSRPIGQLS